MIVTTQPTSRPQPAGTTRIPELLSLVRSYLDVEVVLVMVGVTPSLGETPRAAARPTPRTGAEATIVHDPDRTHLAELTRTAARTGSTVALPVPELDSILVLRARRDVTRDLRPTAELVAELLVQTAGTTGRGARTPAVPGEHRTCRSAGRPGDGKRQDHG